MGKEHTIARAETVVLHAETRHLNVLIRGYTRNKLRGSKVAYPYWDDLVTERKRLCSKGKYDHEEVWIYNRK